MTLMGVIGCLSAVPAPWPALSLETRLGRTLFVGSFILLGVVGLIASIRKGLAGDRERAQRDAAMEESAERRLEVILAQFAQQNQQSNSLAGLVSAGFSTLGALEKRGSGGTPLARIVEATGVAAAGAIVSGYSEITGAGAPEVKVQLRGTARATPSRSLGNLSSAKVDEATELVRSIGQNPPTTPEAEAAAAEQLNVYLTPAAAVVSVTVPEVTITGTGAATLTPAAAEVTVTAIPPTLTTPGSAQSASDSEALPQTKAAP